MFQKRLKSALIVAPVPLAVSDAFKGPGQLLGPVKVDTHGYSDVWSNDISDVAIRARQQEDADEDAAWEATKVAKGWTNGLPRDASGTVLAIMSGRSITGRFHALPEGRVVRAGGHLFQVSYRHSRVTLTVMRRGH